MYCEVLRNICLQEQRQALISGWDFTHLGGRCVELPLPWDYAELARSLLAPTMRLLDLDTGGGEFLRTLAHPAQLTSVTEGYAPNVALLQRTQRAEGVDVQEVYDDASLPFADSTFDLVLCRHGRYNAREIFRVLRPGGCFLTQQVGAENDLELRQLLLTDASLPFPEQYLQIALKKFREAGFEIFAAQESFPQIRFLDVGALVWFARVLPWEFPAFSVETCFPALCRAEKILREKGSVAARMHRFLLGARRPA